MSGKACIADSCAVFCVSLHPVMVSNIFVLKYARENLCKALLIEKGQHARKIVFMLFLFGEC